MCTVECKRDCLPRGKLSRSVGLDLDECGLSLLYWRLVQLRLGAARGTMHSRGAGSCGVRLFRGCFDIGEKAFRDAVGGGFHRAPRKVDIAGSGLGLTVTEELAGHWQSLAKRQGSRRQAAT